MATLKSGLTLTSTDLLSDTISFTTTTNVTASHTTGMARAAVTCFRSSNFVHGR